jgi:hypothetical protein
MIVGSMALRLDRPAGRSRCSEVTIRVPPNANDGARLATGAV